LQTGGDAVKKVSALFRVWMALAMTPPFGFAREVPVEKITITSPAFPPDGMIPSRYTCDAEDISPQLDWSGVPASAKSLVLVSDDPDAPVGTWVHWVIYDLPPGTTGLPEGIPKSDTVSGGGIQGMTDFRTIGYGGPCPPGGIHRYFFKIYALDVATLGLGPGATKKDVENAMRKHVIAAGEMKGLYSRARKERG
jgi:hypothetical protein